MESLEEFKAFCKTAIDNSVEMQIQRCFDVLINSFVWVSGPDVAAVNKFKGAIKTIREASNQALAVVDEMV